MSDTGGRSEDLKVKVKVIIAQDVTYSYIILSISHYRVLNIFNKITCRERKTFLTLLNSNLYRVAAYIIPWYKKLK